MMSPEAIRSESDRAARRAARERREPYVVFDEREARSMQSFPFPFLGDYVPRGWEKVEDLFCDSSGFGSESEPALTQGQLRDKVCEYLALPDTYGFAVTEAGQFQVYVGVFKKVPVRAARPRKSRDVWPTGGES